MTTITANERRARRRAYLYGRAQALRPPADRHERIEQARRSLMLLSEVDRYALLAEFALGEGPEAMIKAASLLLGGVSIIGNRLPQIHRVCLAAAVNKEAEKLAFPSEYPKTLH